MVENPPWVDRVLRTHWAALNQASPVPLFELSGRKNAMKYQGEELGCGHYGCVLTVNHPGVVLKLTTDPSEAQFITESMKLGEPPTGIVRYLQILPLEDSHKNRPVFAIWREAAYGVGTQMDEATYSYLERMDAYDQRLARESKRRLEQWLYTASDVRATIQRGGPQMLAATRLNRDWAWDQFEWDVFDKVYALKTARTNKFRGPQRVAYGLRALQVVAEMGENEAFMPEVFGALGFYLDRGLLLADVHWGNIGKVNREDYQNGVRVITDPGHLVDVRGAL